MIVSRALAKARVHDLSSPDLEDFDGPVVDIKDEQKRYVNFWIGVQKSIQMKLQNHQMCEVKVHNHFKKKHYVSLMLIVSSTGLNFSTFAGE